MQKKFLAALLFLIILLSAGCGNASQSGHVEITEAQTESEPEVPDHSEEKFIKTAAGCQSIYEQAKAAGTLDSLETQKQFVKCLGKMGYAATDLSNQIDMQNAEKMLNLIAAVREKKTAEGELVCVGSEGDFIGFLFQTSDGKVNVTEKHIGWKGTVPEVLETTKYEAHTWNYTEEGYLFLEQYHMPGYDGASGHRAIRILPLDEKCRELNRKYILPVGYQLNNLFTVEWDEKEFGSLDFYDLFDLFYPETYKKALPYTADADLGKGNTYTIPEAEFEKVIRQHLAISSKTLQSKTDYQRQGKSYEYRPRGLEDCEPPSYPFPEVESYVTNGDGTITLKVNAVYPDHDIAKAFSHEVTIRLLPDGMYQYVSNHILPDENNDTDSWRVNRLTDEEWKEAYGTD